MLRSKKNAVHSCAEMLQKLCSYQATDVTFDDTSMIVDLRGLDKVHGSRDSRQGIIRERKYQIGLE